MSAEPSPIQPFRDPLRPAGPPSPLTPTILVVEDDSQVRDFLEKVLRRRGYRVVAACSGRGALECVRDEVIDLIVTDLCMPQMDGIELVMNLRKLGRDIPVIAMSGALVGYTSDMLRAIELLGAKATFEKPFAPLRLVEAVEQVVGGPLLPPNRS